MGGGERGERNGRGRGRRGGEEWEGDRERGGRGMGGGETRKTEDATVDVFIKTTAKVCRD